LTEHKHLPPFLTRSLDDFAEVERDKEFASHHRKEHPFPKGPET
jgi:hypothetical protein